MKILVAMSGGVDSSTAAFLLREQGHAVVGATLRLWHAEDDKHRPGGCCALEDIHDARRVCDFLGIRHYVLNREQEFRRCVVDSFVTEYLSGSTPNPCIVCNEKIKFDLLLKDALAQGFDCLATGHYVRTDQSGGHWRLLTGRDPAKEQTYVLYRLGQFELAHLQFPLGGLTKQEVRAIARKANLPAAEKRESQEICFVPEDYPSFLKSYLPDFDQRVRPGPIVDRTGRVVGTHRGLALYTIGQRSGLGLTTPEPVYVIRMDTAANTLVIGSKDEVYAPGAHLKHVTWVSGTAPAFPVYCAVKIRRLHQPAPATLAPAEGDEVLVTFAAPQPAVTPGQAAVFYAGDTVLGGGIIS